MVLVTNLNKPSGDEGRKAVRHDRVDGRKAVLLGRGLLACLLDCFA